MSRKMRDDVRSNFQPCLDRHVDAIQVARVPFAPAQHCTTYRGRASNLFRRVIAEELGGNVLSEIRIFYLDAIVQ